jgi:hypothetical protein
MLVWRLRALAKLNEVSKEKSYMKKQNFMKNLKKIFDLMLGNN